MACWLLNKAACAVSEFVFSSCAAEALRDRAGRCLSRLSRILSGLIVAYEDASEAAEDDSLLLLSCTMVSRLLTKAGRTVFEFVLWPCTAEALRDCAGRCLSRLLRILSDLIVAYENATETARDDSL